MNEEQLNLLLEYIDAKIAYEFASRDEDSDYNSKRKYMEFSENKLREKVL